MSDERAERFRAKYLVNQETGCWEWRASKNAFGYGTFAIGGNRSALAHRWSLEHHRGPLNPELVIDHLCRVRHCVNPDHMEQVSRKENILRGVGAGAGNAKKATCPRGHEYVPRTDGKGRKCQACIRARWREKHGTTDVRVLP